MHKRLLFLSIVLITLSFASIVNSQETTTPAGTDTTEAVVEEDTTAEAPNEATSQPANVESTPPASSSPNLIGPTGVTGTIRRSDRRQEHRSGKAHIQ